MRLREARFVDGIIAALALVVASWPLTTLLRSGEWIRPAMLFIGLVAVIGMLGRAAGLRGWLVLTGQLVVVLVTASWVYAPGRLWHGLPRWETVQAGVELVQDAVHTITSFAPPAPVTPGILFATGGLLALIACLVDYLAVTRRAPALAGMPLLVTFLVSAANSGSSLSPIYFIALALAWLIMLARQGTALLVRWSSADATPSTPARDVGQDRGVSSYAALARSLGVGTLALAVVLPALLPQLPPHYLASGLGRGAGATGGSSQVGFTQTLDLLADLSSRSTTPVLTFRTNDPEPPPLRVTASSLYDGRRWRPTPTDTRAVADSTTPRVPTPLGLSAAVSRTPYHLQVESNTLKDPQLALPFPLAKADLGGIRWGLTDNSSVLVAERPSHYSADYLEVAPNGDLPAILDNDANSSVPLAPLAMAGDPTIDPRDVERDPQSARRITALTQKVVGDEESLVGKAVLIQNYLRDPTTFTYSLTLAAPVKGPDGDDLDPISQFLVTKRGYCIQFASTMIMMARAEGIPARMGVGFLPGEKDAGGLYQATAAQAHAWPELFIPGMGWTRFEPTPGVRSGEPPSYALRVPDAATAGGHPVDQQPPSAAAQPVPGAQKPPADVASETDTSAASPSAVHRLWQQLPLVLLVLVLVVLGALIVPLAGRYRRRSGERDAVDERARVEAEWSALCGRLMDYGIARPGLRSPSEMELYYRHQLLLDEAHVRVLERVVGTLERSRYAAPGQEPLSIEGDARELVQAVSATRSHGMRVRARLWPHSGIEQLTVWAGAVGDLLRRPGRWVDAGRRSQRHRGRVADGR